MMVCPHCHHIVSSADPKCVNPYCNRPLRKFHEVKLPIGVFGKEMIVGIVNFRGDVIIATQSRVFRMSEDEFQEVKFEQVESM